MPVGDRVKIFEGHSTFDLENRVNAWLNEVAEARRQGKLSIYSMQSCVGKLGYSVFVSYDKDEGEAK